MKNIINIFLLLACYLTSFQITNAQSRWITSTDEKVNEPNTWIAYRKDVLVEKVPAAVIARIAVDSKYWLWINGKMVVFEGGLKRGPNPRDTYYDEVDIAPFLKNGDNKIAILLWYFGKEGFSHKSSGKAGIIFDAKLGTQNLISDASWLCKIHPAYGNTGEPFPNYRLPESNIRFDAREDINDWQTADCQSLYGFGNAVELGNWGDTPWNSLIKRPIPFWKDFGIKKATKLQRIKGRINDTIVATLPYNMQMTPIVDISDKDGGNLISISTDHTEAGGDINLRAEYITKKGDQYYESLGWLNGQKIYVTVPSDVKINDIKYRETGYNTEIEGTFSCSDAFYMRFWDKAVRTLYVNMRDTYFDCPDRERAQWWGDVVVLMGQSFYTYSSSTHSLMSKAIKELAAWQKSDGTLFSPVPAGNYDKELPGQMLASIGYYGFWNYYMNTGDKETIKEVYPAVKKYLSLWTLDNTGLTAFRAGGWTWGDWGDSKDIRLIFAGWHYLALKGAALMANELGYVDDAEEYKAIMNRVKNGYNSCWNGLAYKHPDYKGSADDRVQALAVIAGIADRTKYPDIIKLLNTQFYASPYMEKYVMEALFIMGEGKYALERTKTRFSNMVNHKGYTTLFEGWDAGGYGGGSVNHAWSGGTLNVLAQYVCGVYPLEPAYKVFKIEPNPASFSDASITIPSVAGKIKSGFVNTVNEFLLKFSVPHGTEAVVYLPESRDKTITVNGKKLAREQYEPKEIYNHKTKHTLAFPAGDYILSVKN